MKTLLYLYWIILLYKPDWMLAEFFPFLGFLPRINILLLSILFISVFVKGDIKGNLLFLLPFLLMCLFSLAFAQNTGAGRPALKMVFQYYMLGVASLTYLKTRDDTKTLMLIILFHFTYYCFWGIVDGGKVLWHNRLNETNAFGPYMIMGIAFSMFYLFSAKRNYEKISCYLNIVIGLGCVGLTFTMGSFLTLFFVGAYLFLRYPKKLRAIGGIITLTVTFILSVNFLLPEGDVYWGEMGKMKTELGRSGAGGERLMLWKIAMREFYENPILGVGLNNFGVLAPEYTTDSEILSAHLTWTSRANLWGFSLHNSHLEVLTEMGIIGFVIYLRLFIDFWKKNKAIRRGEKLGNAQSQEQYQMYEHGNEFQGWPWNQAVSLALEGGMIVYIASGMVYGLLFYPDLWVLLISNNVIYKSLKEEVSVSGDPLNICGA